MRNQEKKQQKEIKKQLKRWSKEAKKFNKYCKKTFPDWKDDDYNCGDCRFVWGVTFEGERAESFVTLNIAELFYSRIDKRYWLVIDDDLLNLLLYDIPPSPYEKMISLKQYGDSLEKIENIFSQFEAWFLEQDIIINTDGVSYTDYARRHALSGPIVANNLVDIFLDFYALMQYIRDTVV